jgi:CheY-like chemotaxis protein
VIQGCVERIAAKAGTKGESQWELDTIGNAVQRGAELSRRLLTFGSKVESRPAPIDMNQRVRDVRPILEQTLPRAIEIEISLNDDIPPVKADAAQLEQVLLNLAVNARDAMPNGGELRIETDRSDMDGRRLETRASGDDGEWVVLRVSDTGQGMDDATVRQIFDPFFTTKAVGVGTGLGLSTVYGIVTGHGGRITCKSEVGRGTTFVICLPGISGGAPVVEREVRQDERTRRGNETILLVDDEMDMLEVMRENLQEYGYVIHTASSGEKALEFFGEHRQEVDLVILDIGMPGMGGRTCLEKLLELDPDARVIVSTGYGARRDQEQIMEAGACGFLAKPSRIADILREIEMALNV